MSGVKIGNFVETKKSKVKSNSKVNHLSYIGDSEIGKNTNIGAGTITCNYDGIKKNKTIISDNVFIGSNTSLVAPVKIKRKSIVGAGSVITKDVKENSLALERSEQEEIENYKEKNKMCGIIGIASNKSVSTNIIDALKKLEYRGYDSAGLATITNGQINEKKMSRKSRKIRKNFISKSKRRKSGHRSREMGHTRCTKRS